MLSLRKALRENLLPDFLDKVREGEDFDIFVDEVARWLPKTVSKDCLYESLRHLAGEKLTRDVLDQTCWRLSGNLHRLKGREPVTPWTCQPIEEWVPAQIVGAKRRRGPRDKPGWMFTFHILAGRSCPLRIQHFWPSKFCNLMARHMGFRTRPPSDRSSRPTEFLYLHATELVTMRLALLIDPKESKSEPDFVKTDMTPQLKDWNREQMRFRDRIKQGHRCPRRYPPSVKCYRCTAGFKTCQAGTHKEDYIIAPCDDCGHSEAAFDPDVSDDVCLNCHDRRVMKRS